MQQHEPKDDLNVLEKMGYETRDLVAQKAAKFVGYTAFFTILVFVVSWLIIGAVEGATGADVRVFSNEPSKTFKRMPEAPYPLLQTNRTAGRDMYDMKQAEKEMLNTYGDSEPGMARMPIDKAVAKTMDKGLPVRKNAGSEVPK